MEEAPLNKDDQSSQFTEKPHCSTWKPGFWRRFPKTGVLALFLAIFASGSIIYIIRTSDGQPISSWRYQPTVCLAISYTIANIALQYALAQAIAIAWWAKALKGDAKLQDLHNIWAFGHGFWAILASGRSFNFIALAGLVVTLAPINGPLLQRASVIHEQTRIESKYINISIAQEFPTGYSGEITGRGMYTPNSLSPSFSTIVQQHTNALPMKTTNSGCIGTCKGILYGAGYAMTCTKDTTSPFDIQGDYDAIIANINNPNSTGGNLLTYSFFESNFTYISEMNAAPNTTNVMNFTALYKGESTCSGELNRTLCRLHPATIGYPVVMNNDTISLDPAGSWKTDQVHGLHASRMQTYYGPTTHGGLYLYVNELYQSSMGMVWDGGVGWRSWTSGTTGYRYAKNVGGVDNNDIQGGCDMTYVDPTSDILNTVREIAFRAALYVTGDDAITAYGRASAGVEDPAPPLSQGQRDDRYRRAISVDQIRPEVVYKSQYQYLAIAVSLTLMATFCVMVILSGWWSLGREVSLSPIEIAKAFHAPLLERTLPNASATALLKDCGKKKVRYGAVWEREGWEREMPTLRFEKVGGCEKPRDGQVFG